MLTLSWQDFVCALKPCLAQSRFCVGVFLAFAGCLHAPIVWAKEPRYEIPFSTLEEEKAFLQGSAPTVDNSDSATQRDSLNAYQKLMLPEPTEADCLRLAAQKAWGGHDRPFTEVGGDQQFLQGSAPMVNNSNAETAFQSRNAEQSMDMEEDACSPFRDRAPGALTDRYNLIGGAFGIRNFLDRFGVKVGALDIEEVWGNPSGGTPSQADGSPVWGGDGHGKSQGAGYEGVTMLTLQAYPDKLFGKWAGHFQVSGLQIRGREFSQDHLALYNPISGQEGDRSFRLFELWYDQPFFNDLFDVRIGQMDLDTEFMISSYGGLYLNADFGWSMLPSADLYAGGPSWPISSPGVRFRYRPSQKFSFLFAAIDDNPPGNQFNSFPIQNGGNTVDPSNQDVGAEASGTKFNLNTGALLISEIQYSTFLGGKKHGFPGIYKLGGYYDSAFYPDYYTNQEGEPLGNPNDLGNPNTPSYKKGNWAIYGIVDQMIWRSHRNRNKSVGVFFHGTGTQGDRNTVVFEADAGINLKSPFLNRPDDTLGLAWVIGVTGDGERHFDRESGAIMQSTENHLELTYQAMVTPWFNIQPDFQYVWRPSGGVQDYAAKTLERVGDEAVFGLHADLKF
ncbi:carbohydrate porin [Acetobacteraceae bacterium]|nr:carbohydrate porin [Acetobacteraceae bacterium]